MFFIPASEMHVIHDLSSHPIPSRVNIVYVFLLILRPLTYIYLAHASRLISNTPVCLLAGLRQVQISKCVW